MKKGFKLLDGAMGTYLHSKVSDKSKRTDSYNISNEELVYAIHKEYIDAGAEIINTNTFISNYLWDSGGFCVEDAIKKAIGISKKAAKDNNILVALDIGPCKNIDENNFEKMISIGEEEGVDLYIGETFTNLDEAIRLIHIWKSKSQKPLIVSFSLQKDFVLSDGTSLEEIANAMEDSGILALGINCGFGLKHSYEGILKLKEYTKLPIMAKPNLGCEEISSKNEFLAYGEKFNSLGVKYLGGCCGSTPKYIYELKMNFS